MEDTLALIRLLAETPSDVSPLVRTRDIIEGAQREQVVREGVTPPGNAVPPVDPDRPKTETFKQASPYPSAQSKGVPITAAYNPDVLGRGVKWVVPQEHVHKPASAQPARQAQGRPASPTPRVDRSGPAANPTTGIPSVGGKVEVSTVKPASVAPANVMSPETFFGKAATPHIMRAVEGVPAEVRRTQYVQAVASPTPTSTVSITIPPLFPVDPTQAFARVDEEMKLPPRQPSQQLEKLQSSLMVIPDDTLPSESVVARSTVNSMDDDMERWVI